MPSDDARPLLLLVDDDPAISDTLDWVLRADFEILVAPTRSAALAAVRAATRPIDAALIDLGLPPHPHRPDEGLALISELLAAAPWLKIVVLSGQDAEASARHARALGAWDFRAKPAPPPELRDTLLRAARMSREERSAEAAAGPLLGDSPPMCQLREQVRAFADAPFPVLIEGESGTGKELVAQALHGAGRRRSRPFVALNCAAIAPGLIETALFGHTRGAFTGSTASRPGFFEEAADGTLFLDEIGELPLDLQPKLLRVLETGDFQRVGETQPRRTTARVVAATNRQLREEVRAGRFRADLYHRLGVLTLALPPLRTLGDDRFRLLDHYCRALSAQTGLAAFALTDAARAVWARYSFPGNVRELRNIVMRLLARHAGRPVEPAALEAELDLLHLPADDTAPDTAAAAAGPEAQLLGGATLDEILRDTERRCIDAAIRASRGNMAGAARLLGINRSTLYGRLSVLGLRVPGE